MLQLGRERTEKWKKSNSRAWRGITSFYITSTWSLDISECLILNSQWYGETVRDRPLVQPFRFGASVRTETDNSQLASNLAAKLIIKWNEFDFSFFSVFSASSSTCDDVKWCTTENLVSSLIGFIFMLLKVNSENVHRRREGNKGRTRWNNILYTSSANDVRFVLDLHQHVQFNLVAFLFVERVD